jgi:hypothetical protein
LSTLTFLGFACAIIGLLGFWSEEAARSLGFPGSRRQRIVFGTISTLLGVVLVYASRGS